LSGLMSEISIFEESDEEINLNKENSWEVILNEDKGEFMGKITEDLEDFGQTE
jgi:hypothetical protein